jgi:hypothetical protein
MSNTPNMDLIINQVGVTTNPTWATNITSNFATVDAHDHSANNGVQITPAGMNITEDLSFNDNNATDLRSSIYQNQSAVLAAPTDINSAYFVSGNFYINNASGVPVQITLGTGLNFASLGAIGGDYGQPGVTAAVTYNNSVGAKYYQFFSSSGVYAAMLTGPVTITNVAGTQGVTLNSPAGLAAAYTITLPAALPAAQNILTIDNTGATSFIGYSTSNVANAVVQRDASGNFTANNITSVGDVVVTGTVNTGSITSTGSLTVSAAIVGSSSITATGYIQATGGLTSDAGGANAVKMTSRTGSINGSSNVTIGIAGATNLWGVCGRVGPIGGVYYPIVDYLSDNLATQNCVSYLADSGSNQITLSNLFTNAITYRLTIFYT